MIKVILKETIEHKFFGNNLMKAIELMNSYIIKTNNNYDDAIWRSITKIKQTKLLTFLGEGGAKITFKDPETSDYVIKIALSNYDMSNLKKEYYLSTLDHSVVPRGYLHEKNYMWIVQEEVEPLNKLYKSDKSKLFSVLPELAVFEHFDEPIITIQRLILGIINTKYFEPIMMLDKVTYDTQEQKRAAYQAILRLYVSLQDIRDFVTKHNLSAFDYSLHNLGISKLTNKLVVHDPA